MTTFNDIRAIATSSLHTTVRIHRKNGTYQVYKNGVLSLESKDWNVVKECALSSPGSDRTM